MTGSRPVRGGPRRVLWLTKTTALGGAERLMASLFPHLDRAHFAYQLVALDAAGPLATAARDAGVPLRALPQPRALDPRNVIALRRWLREERIDLVHAHLPLPGALARLAARGLPTRIVYTEHNLPPSYRAPSRWLNAATYGWQQRVVAVSREVGASAAQGPAARRGTPLQVIPNGVDLERLELEAAALPAAPLPPRRRGERVALVPARLVREKGHDLLLDALARLAHRPFPPLSIWCAGEGPERRRLARRARALGLAAAVHWLGQREDVYALIRSADFVVLPSRVEGHPLALLEALALGRPVLATAVGGVPEIVADGQTGLCVPAGDVAALAAGLDRLRSEPALRASLGRNAARDARRRFDVRRVARDLEALYHQVLAEPAPVRSRRERSAPLPRPPLS